MITKEINENSSNSNEKSNKNVKANHTDIKSYITQTITKEIDTIIPTIFDTMEAKIAARPVYVMFEDSLGCNPLTDHKIPKNILPLFKNIFTITKNNIEEEVSSIITTKVLEVIESKFNEATMELDMTKIELTKTNQKLMALKTTNEKQAEELKQIQLEAFNEKQQLVNQNNLLKEMVWQKQRITGSGSRQAYYGDKGIFSHDNFLSQTAIQLQLQDSHNGNSIEGLKIKQEQEKKLKETLTELEKLKALMKKTEHKNGKIINNISKEEEELFNAWMKKMGITSIDELMKRFEKEKQESEALLNKIQKTENDANNLKKKLEEAGFIISNDGTINKRKHKNNDEDYYYNDENSEENKYTVNKKDYKKQRKFNKEITEDEYENSNTKNKKCRLNDKENIDGDDSSINENIRVSLMKTNLPKQTSTAADIKNAMKNIFPGMSDSEISELLKILDNLDKYGINFPYDVSLYSFLKIIESLKKTIDNLKNDNDQLDYNAEEEKIKNIINKTRQLNQNMISTEVEAGLDAALIAQAQIDAEKAGKIRSIWVGVGCNGIIDQLRKEFGGNFRGIRIKTSYDNNKNEEEEENDIDAEKRKAYAAHKALKDRMGALKNQLLQFNLQGGSVFERLWNAGIALKKKLDEDRIKYREEENEITTRSLKYQHKLEDSRKLKYIEEVVRSGEFRPIYNPGLSALSVALQTNPFATAEELAFLSNGEINTTKSIQANVNFKEFKKDSHQADNITNNIDQSLSQINNNASLNQQQNEHIKKEVSNAFSIKVTANTEEGVIDNAQILDVQRPQKSIDNKIAVERMKRSMSLSMINSVANSPKNLSNASILTPRKQTTYIVPPRNIPNQPIEMQIDKQLINNEAHSNDITQNFYTYDEGKSNKSVEIPDDAFQNNGTGLNLIRSLSNYHLNKSQTNLVTTPTIKKDTSFQENNRNMISKQQKEIEDSSESSMIYDPENGKNNDIFLNSTNANLNTNKDMEEVIKQPNCRKLDSKTELSKNSDDLTSENLEIMSQNMIDLKETSTKNQQRVMNTPTNLIEQNETKVPQSQNQSYKRKHVIVPSDENQINGEIINEGIRCTEALENILANEKFKQNQSISELMLSKTNIENNLTENLNNSINLTTMEKQVENINSKSTFRNTQNSSTQKLKISMPSIEKNLTTTIKKVTNRKDGDVEAKILIDTLLNQVPQEKEFLNTENDILLNYYPSEKNKSKSLPSILQSVSNPPNKLDGLTLPSQTGIKTIGESGFKTSLIQYDINTQNNLAISDLELIDESKAVRSGSNNHHIINKRSIYDNSKMGLSMEVESRLRKMKIPKYSPAVTKIESSAGL